MPPSRRISVAWLPRGIGTPFQILTGDENGDLTLCGVGGWYTSSNGSSRDTDWFIPHAGAGAGIAITADAEYATHMFELGPQDCASVAVVQLLTAGPCAPATMTITGYAPDAPVWFWAGSTVFAPPSGAETSYDYVVWFSGLAPGPVDHGNVKILAMSVRTSSWVTPSRSNDRRSTGSDRSCELRVHLLHGQDEAIQVVTKVISKYVEPSYHPSASVRFCSAASTRSSAVSLSERYSDSGSTTPCLARRLGS